MRHEFSRKTKAEAFLRCGGYCEGKDCGIKMVAGDFHYDHRNPDAISADNSLENCQVLCRLCHRLKTKDDIGTIAKNNRIRDKARGIKKHKYNWPKRKLGY